MIAEFANKVRKLFILSGNWVTEALDLKLRQISPQIAVFTLLSIRCQEGDNFTLLNKIKSDY